MEKVKVKETPKINPYTGFTIARNSVAYTPDEFLDNIGAEKENRPVFMVRPMTVEERSMVDADNSRAMAETCLWFGERGIDIKEVTSGKTSANNYVSYTQMLKHFADQNIRNEVVRKNITNIKLKGEAKALKFSKDDEGYLCKEEFDTYPAMLIDALFDEINRISNPDRAMVLGLLS